MLSKVRLIKKGLFSLIFYSLTIDNILNIVVLIILATISINAVLGENGIIKRAESARQHQANAETRDNEALDELSIYLGDSIAEQEGKVARIGTTYYKSLQEAFDAVPTDGTKTTVELLKSISENVLVKENQNIVLNMNGKTITNIEGTAVAGDWNQSTFEVYGDLEVNNGKIVAVYGNGIENYGNVVSLNENMEIIAEEGAYPALYNEGSNAVMYVNGGTVSAEDNSAIYNYGGEVVISGGTVIEKYRTVNAIYNAGGTIVINDLCITEEFDRGKSSPAIYNEEGGNIEMNGGTIIVDSTCIYSADEEGEVVINGGYLEGPTLVYTYSNLYINGGKFETTYSFCSIVIKSDTAECIITDGEFYTGVDFTTSLTITGGKFVDGWSSGYMCSSSDNAVLNIGSLEDEVNINNPIIVTDRSPVIEMFGENSVINFYNGAIKAKEEDFAISNSGTINCREGYTIKYSTEDNYTTAYLGKDE